MYGQKKRPNILLKCTRIGEDESFTIKVGESPVVIGKKTIPELAEDRYLSGQHARVSLSGDGILLEDLDSANGCYILQKAPSALSPGERFVIGERVVEILVEE